MAPDVGLGSEEARAARAYVFYEYLIREMCKEPETCTPSSLANLLLAASRPIGYEMSQQALDHLTQTGALLDLQLILKHQYALANCRGCYALVPPTSQLETLEGISQHHGLRVHKARVQAQLQFLLHTRVLDIVNNIHHCSLSQRTTRRAAHGTLSPTLYLLH